jgi:hypothetical protein
VVDQDWPEDQEEYDRDDPCERQTRHLDIELCRPGGLRRRRGDGPQVGLRQSRDGPQIILPSGDDASSETAPRIGRECGIPSQVDTRKVRCRRCHSGPGDTAGREAAAFCRCNVLLGTRRRRASRSARKRARCGRDAGRRTPDAGRRTPDAGRRTPDAGRRTPDAGRRVDVDVLSPTCPVPALDKSALRQVRSGARRPPQCRPPGQRPIPINEPAFDTSIQLRQQ